MQPSDSLSQLIHSLTKGEKRLFFQQSKNLSGQKAYMKLYRLIEKDKHYDENKAMKILGFEKNLQGYYNLKNYLLRSILKSLIPACDSPDGKIAKKILFAKTLIRKGIYSQARKTILPLLDQVQREELFCYAMELTQMYMRIESQIQNEREKIKAYRKDILVKLCNWQAYENLFEDLQPYVSTFATVLGVEVVAGLNEIRKSRLFHSVETAICARSKRIYWGMHYLSSMLEGDFRKALTSCEELILLFESHLFLQKGHWEEFSAIQVNRGRLKLTLGQVEECAATLHQLSGVKNPQIKILELAYSVKTGNKDTGIPLLAQLEGIIQTEDLKGDCGIAFLYEIALAYLSFGEPAKALSHILTLNHNIRSKTRIDLQWAVRLLHLVAAIDLEDWQLVEWCYRNAYRFQYCRDLSLGYDLQFLFALNRICKKPLLEKFTALETEIERLESLTRDHAQAKTLIYFDGIVWLKGKREGKPIWEINRATLFNSQRIGEQPS